MSDPRQTIREFIARVLPELTAVIDLDEPESDAPRPPLPYAGIKLDSDQPDGWQTPYRWTEDTGASVPPAQFPEHLQWARQANLVVALYGAGCQERARKLQIALASSAEQETLDAAGVTIRHTMTVTNDSTILDTSREPRATATFEVGWEDSYSADIDVIETVDPGFTVEE